MHFRHSFARYIILTALSICFTAAISLANQQTTSASLPTQSRKVTLRLWGGLWGVPQKDETLTMPWMRSTRAVFDEFKKEHPEIEIVSSSGLIIKGPAADSNFLLAMAGGNAPDVFYVNFRKLHTFIGQNFLQPLDEYVKQDPEVLSRVHPTIRRVITVNGHTYCIPWFQGATALFYRKDLFRQAGLDPDRPPRNWDEFYQYAQKLTIPEQGQWGFFFPATEGAYFLTNFIWQAGGEVVTQDEDGHYKAVFNSEAGAEALRFYAKLTRGRWTRNGKTYYGVANIVSGDYKLDINRGKLAMWFADTYDAITTRSEISPSLLGVAPLPEGPTGIKANEINAGMWGMSTQIKDPRVKKAAWEYIKFMSGPRAEEIRTRSFVENGLWKYVPPDKLAKYGYKEYVSDIPQVWLQASKDAFLHGRPEPNGPNLEMLYNEMDPPMQAIYQNPDADARALLDACAKRINTKLLGNVPAEEMRGKRSKAWGILLIVLVVAAVVVTRQTRTIARAHAADAAGSHGPRRGIRHHFTAWVFMLPAVLSVGVWMYYPLLRGMVMAFQDYRILGGTKWVGIDNFIQVAGQDVFWRSLLNSFMYVGISLSIGFFVPIILALMLAEVPRGKMLFRTLYYLPAVTSSLVIMFLWKWFYDPSPQGLFNTLIAWLHIPAQTWLNDSHLAMLCVIIPVIWAGAGPGSIIYLAALKSIPEDMYEAADLDGAGIWHKVRHIVLPMLKPLIIINLVGAFIGAFKAMENVFIMTGGGPNYATHVIGLDIWYNAFMFLKFGFATSEAWIVGSLLIGFTLYQLRILKDLKFSAGGG